MADNLITGIAYGERATLEICGEALTWRARPNAEHRENVATTIHDIRASYFLEQRISLLGITLVATGIAMWLAVSVASGAAALAAGIALMVWRATHTRRVLILDLTDRRLTIDVDLPSAPLARTLVTRIERVIRTGEAPSSPASLP